MRLKYHGGHCCGIRHIEGLPVGPYKVLEKVLPESPPSYEYQSDDVFALSEEGTTFPAGTYKERLGHYIEWQKARQPSGLIEVTTHSASYHVSGGKTTTQTEWWREELEKIGFKEVTSFVNSNSFRTVTVWHYAYGPANEVEKEVETETKEGE